MQRHPQAAQATLHLPCRQTTFATPREGGGGGAPPLQKVQGSAPGSAWVATPRAGPDGSAPAATLQSDDAVMAAAMQAAHALTVAAPTILTMTVLTMAVRPLTMDVLTIGLYLLKLAGDGHRDAQAVLATPRGSSAVDDALMAGAADKIFKLPSKQRV